MMQIIFILRSIRTFAIKNLSGTDYQGLYLRGMIEWLKKYYSMVSHFLQTVVKSI